TYRRLGLSAKLLRVLDGEARRLAAAFRPLRRLCHALWLEGSFLRRASARPVLREVPPPRNEAVAPRSKNPCRALRGRATGSHRVQEFHAAQRQGTARGSAGLDRASRGAKVDDARTFGDYLKSKVKLEKKTKGLNFQDLILQLSHFWVRQGCVLQQPYDVEVGAGTMHPQTFLRVLGTHAYRVAYVQPSRRPADGRYGENPKIGRASGRESV